MLGDEPTALAMGCVPVRLGGSIGGGARAPVGADLPLLDGYAAWAAELGAVAGPAFSPPRFVKGAWSASQEAASLATAELLKLRVAQQQKKKKKKGGTPSTSVAEEEPPPLLEVPRPAEGWPLAYVRDFALSGRERRENNYPVCEGGSAPADDDGTSSASDASDAEDGGTGAAGAAGAEGASAPSAARPRLLARLLGVDCEMGCAGAALQLARVAVVDEAGRVLLDELARRRAPWGPGLGLWAWG